MKTSPLSLKSRLDLASAGQFFPVSSSLVPVTTDDLDDPSHPVHGTYSTGTGANTDTEDNPLPPLPAERIFARDFDHIPLSLEDLLFYAPAPSVLTDEEYLEEVEAHFYRIEQAEAPTFPQKARAILLCILFSCIVYMVLLSSIVPHVIAQGGK